MSSVATNSNSATPVTASNTNTTAGGEGFVTPSNTNNITATSVQDLDTTTNNNNVGNQATWSLSSCKPGFGVEQLRDDNTETYWQSDGQLPHLVNIQFRRKTTVSSVEVYADYKLDESYTPSKISVRSGTNFNDLQEIEVLELSEPSGWIQIPLKDLSERSVRAFMVQIAVIANHQQGRDTHLRQIRIHSPLEERPVTTAEYSSCLILTYFNMATLDDKLLGEKLHYYCSSSEDEEEKEQPSNSNSRNPDISNNGTGTVNTGPKGVVKDYMRYKQLENEQREEQAKEKLELAKKLSLTCRSINDDDKAKDEEDELDALFDDQFMQMYIEKRMREMELKNDKKKYFGEIKELEDGDDFLKAIDEEEPYVSIVVFIYEDDADGCYAMNECLKIVAIDYTDIKFLRISASAVGFSNYFKSNGVPALLLYKGGDLIQSYPKMLDFLGLDFYATDLEAFLIRNNVIKSKT
ncbi:APC10 [Lepeophtheirus salmonis]|uniref:Anaphase-promoting complex subunit 10 n=2 Tax=Lepeophtheirus salmonis TaxID=72036 RepID=A0A7R8H9R9_LEPSM|nr:APC10 [Lepeophtheirus salmonis]CAF2945779.1 APC10 [Lepeophtheirus salmonis]